MLPIFNITDEMTSSATSMDITESFRPEDLSKTDFFDFVSAPEQEGNQAAQNSNIVGTNSTNDQPLQGFDQFWGAEKETQQRLESAIFEDLNRYCWNQQNNAANISISSATANSSSNAGPQVINNGDGQIYTITVLNSSSADQWLRKDISTSSGGGGGGGGDQPNGLDINLDTILSNYPYVKTECFSYDDSGFGTAESTKEDLNYQHPSPQLLQPQSTGVTTTSVLLESNLNANSDLISYTDMSNNNNEWNIDRNEIKDWQTCEANESPESLLRSALQGKGYAKTVHLQNGITVIPAQNSVKDEELRRALFTNDQETLTFADSTLSNSLFDDSQNPQSTLSQHASGVVDDMFLTLDNAFTDEFEKMKRIASEVQQFCTIDSQGNGYGEVITIENNAINATQNSILNSNDLTNNNSLIINNNSHTGKINKSRSNGIKTTKKYKKSINNNNTNIMNNNNNNNDTSTINNNLHNNNKVSAMSNLTTASSNGSSASVMPSNANGLSPGSSTSCNGIRKERSLHYCSICSKGFKDKYSVNVHIRTHTGEKPFSCSLCGKSFRQKAHLAKHYQTHLQKSTNGSVKSKHHQKHSMAAVQSQPIAQTPSLNVINV